MQRARIEHLLTAVGGYEKDRWGNFVKIVFREENGQVYQHKFRIKMQANSLRYEKQVKIGGKPEWLKIVSDYFKNIEERDGGKKISIQQRWLVLKK